MQPQMMTTNILDVLNRPWLEGSGVWTVGIVVPGISVGTGSGISVGTDYEKYRQ